MHMCSKFQDDPSLFDYNVDERVDAFIEDILLAAGNYRTNNVMFTFGSDFQYESAIENYKNIDKLMEYTMQKVTIRFIECMSGGGGVIKYCMRERCCTQPVLHSNSLKLVWGHLPPHDTECHAHVSSRQLL